MPFRQITEMTILTVQLIVEFAKGLPGFAKISQSDQITLLKVKILTTATLTIPSSSVYELTTLPVGHRTLFENLFSTATVGSASYLLATCPLPLPFLDLKSESKYYLYSTVYLFMFNHGSFIQIPSLRIL